MENKSNEDHEKLSSETKPVINTVVAKNKFHSQMYDPIHKIKEHLKEYYHLRYNVISNRIEWLAKNNEHGDVSIKYQHLDDEKFNSILIEIQKDADFKVTHSLLRTVISSNFIESYNPVSNYFLNLPKWDESQPDYIKRLVDRIPTDDRVYAEGIFKKWFTGMVACALLPSAENHIVLLLKGGQGVGKTRNLRGTIPPQLSEYLYEGNINPNNKEHERHLSEKILLIMDEIDMKSERQSEALKSLITRNSITTRKPYAVNPVNLPRVASFCGTTNRSFFLKDPTGNRRFGVINVIGTIDNSEIDFLDNAYAQALYLLEIGFKYYFDEEDILKVNEKNSDYMEYSYEEELLLSSYRVPQQQEQHDAYMTATQVAQTLARKSKISFNARFAQKVGILMSAHGFPSRKSNGAKKYELKEI